MRGHCQASWSAGGRCNARQAVFIGIWLFVLTDTFTFIILMVWDRPFLNAWNWLIIIPVNLFLAQIWPIYWAILHWI